MSDWSVSKEPVKTTLFAVGFGSESGYTTTYYTIEYFDPIIKQ